MARGRSSGYEDQRELILQRAAELFAQRGYSATSMNGVAEACGLSKPALYHYFRDKYALLFEICNTHLTRLLALEQATCLEREAAMRAVGQRLMAEAGGDGGMWKGRAESMMRALLPATSPTGKSYCARAMRRDRDMMSAALSLQASTTDAGVGRCRHYPRCAVDAS